MSFCFTLHSTLHYIHVLFHLTLHTIFFFNLKNKECSSHNSYIEKRLTSELVPSPKMTPFDERVSSLSPVVAMSFHAIY